MCIAAHLLAVADSSYFIYLIRSEPVIFGDFLCNEGKVTIHFYLLLL